MWGKKIHHGSCWWIPNLGYKAARDVNCLVSISCPPWPAVKKDTQAKITQTFLVSGTQIRKKHIQMLFDNARYMFAYCRSRALRVWIRSINLSALPLQEGLVHSLLSWWGPLHSAQPCTDALQRLCLCWAPVLHVTLHLDHSPHSSHWPATGQREWEMQVDMERRGNGGNWREEDVGGAQGNQDELIEVYEESVREKKGCKGGKDRTEKVSRLEVNRI